MLEKLNCYMKRLGIILIMAALIAGMVGCGDTTTPPSQNLEISTWYDLDAVRDNLAGNHILMNDLDSTTPGYEELAGPTANQGKGWQPIANISGAFYGSFDGQGYEVRDLFINRPAERDIGLFGAAYNGTIVKNLGLVNANVIGQWYVGILVGTNYGTVSNSYVTGSVNGEGYVGSLVGGSATTVSNSYSVGSVTGNNFVGGLVGINTGTVSNSYSIGITIGNSRVGGLVGASSGTVSNSYSTSSVTGDTNVGGLVGENLATVSHSFWDIQTSGQDTSDGGTGKNTEQMKSIATFSGAGWNIIEVSSSGERNPSYIWNIVNGVTYPLLSWQS